MSNNLNDLKKTSSDKSKRIMEFQIKKILYPEKLTEDDIKRIECYSSAKFMPLSPVHTEKLRS